MGKRKKKIVCERERGERWGEDIKVIGKCVR